MPESILKSWPRDYLKMHPGFRRGDTVFRSDVAEFGPLAIVLAGLHGGDDELHAFDAICQGGQQAFIGVALAADDGGELAVERSEGFQIPFGVAGWNADIHGRGGIAGNGAATG